METASRAIRDAARLPRLQLVVPRVEDKGASRHNTFAMQEVVLCPCDRYQISMEQWERDDIYFLIHIPFIEPVNFFVPCFNLI